jgi:C1A family cysteine protease
MFKRSSIKPERYFSEYSDLTNAEVEQRLGYNLKESLKENATLAEFEAVNLPKSIDWRSRNVVTKVKNQGKCGNSYIFATIGAIESNLAI